VGGAEAFLKIECRRRWGEPKLKKPKECNNKTLLGSVNFTFGEKYVKCKVWLCGSTVYVLHRDWFSPSITHEEAYKRGIIDSATRYQKFIYNDNFGGVILRSEAVLSFQLPDMSRFILDNRFALVKEFAEMVHREWFDLPQVCRWEDFFEEILKLVKESEGAKEFMYAQKEIEELTAAIKEYGLASGNHGNFDWAMTSKNTLIKRWLALKKVMEERYLKKE